MDEETNFKDSGRDLDKSYVPLTGVASRHSDAESEGTPPPGPRGSSRTFDAKAERGAKAIDATSPRPKAGAPKGAPDLATAASAKKPEMEKAKQPRSKPKSEEAHAASTKSEHTSLPLLQRSIHESGPDPSLPTESHPPSRKLSKIQEAGEDPEPLSRDMKP